MRIASLTFLVAFPLATLGWSDTASACACQKEYMIKKYGKITAIDQERPPVPPKKPAPSSEENG